MTLVIEMKGITKYFASTQVRANDHVDFSVESGEVHGLVGENGAGKTTTVEILEGLTPSDKGTVELLGQHWNRGRDDRARTRHARASR